MKRRVLEIGKDLLILLLIGCLVFLTAASLPVESIRSSPWLSSLLQPIAPLLGLPQSELAYVETALPVLDAAQPLLISVRNDNGRATAMWDFQALDSAFETFGGILGEALDTAGDLKPVSQDRLQQALTGPSVFIGYGTALPADLLAIWLDASMEAGVPEAEAYVLALEGDAVVLYLIGSGCHAAATAVQAPTLSALLSQYKPDGSQFAFEAGSRAAALSLLPGPDAAVHAAASSNPCDSRYTEQLATNLGFNPYGDASYTDGAGNTFFTESNCALQVSASGQVTLTASSEDRFPVAGDGLDACVEAARQLVELVAGQTLGDARMYLSSLTQDGETVTCTFDYVLSGIPVAAGSHGATVTFSGGALLQLEVQVIRCTLSTLTQDLLPVAQAAAILPEGSRLILQYGGVSGALTAGWVEGQP